MFVAFLPLLAVTHALTFLLCCWGGTRPATSPSSRHRPPTPPASPVVRYGDIMIATPRPATGRSPARRAWIPRQHGAWAMLLLPVLLGIAASRPSAWHLALGAAALTAYLASASLQGWSRARRPPALLAPVVVYTTVFGILGLGLIVAFPALALVLVVVGPTAAIVFGGARPGTRRDLANSVAQVVQALVLVPAAAWVSGEFDVQRVMLYTLVATGYLLGTVLVVRSVLRERGNERFALISVGFHLCLVALSALALPLAYTVVGAFLAARAAALPVLQRRWSSGPHPLRPVHVGIVEIVASTAVIVIAFAAPI